MRVGKMDRKRGRVYVSIYLNDLFHSFLSNCPLQLVSNILKHAILACNNSSEIEGYLKAAEACIILAAR